MVTQFSSFTPVADIWHTIFNLTAIRYKTLNQSVLFQVLKVAFEISARLLFLQVYILCSAGMSNPLTTTFFICLVGGMRPSSPQQKLLCVTINY